MAAAQQQTPEEKLFAVIRRDPTARRPAPQVIGMLQAGAAWARQVAVGGMGLPRVNRALGWLIALLGAACVLQPLLFRPRIERVMARAHTEATPFSMPLPLAGLREEAEYVAAMGAHDPFRIGETEPPAAQATGIDALPPEAREALTALRLVGISIGTPSVAMVESQQDQRTYFVREGEALLIFTVKRILPDQVILQYGEQEALLF
jgi:hypothetical protein